MGAGWSKVGQNKHKEDIKMMSSHSRSNNPLRAEIARRIVLISLDPTVDEARRLAPQAARALRIRAERDPEFKLPKALVKRLESPVSSVVKTIADIRAANKIIAASVARVWKAQHPHRPREPREEW